MCVCTHMRTWVDRRDVMEMREKGGGGGCQFNYKKLCFSFLFPSLFTGRMSKGSYSILHVNICSSKCWGKGVCACASAIHISTVTDLIQQQL